MEEPEYRTKNLESFNHKVNLDVDLSVLPWYDCE